jgi:hypothetical protein
MSERMYEGCQAVKNERLRVQGGVEQGQCHPCTSTFYTRREDSTGNLAANTVSCGWMLVRSDIQSAWHSTLTVRDHL